LFSEKEREKEEQRKKDWEREQQEIEEQRQKDWEREQQEKERELAMSIKKELEEELGIESDFNGSDGGSISEVQSESQIDDDEGSLMDNNEEQTRTTGDFNAQNKGVLKDNDDHRGVSHEQPRDLNGQNKNIEGKDILAQTGDLMGRGGTLGDAVKQGEVIGDFEEQESSQWDSSHDEDGESVQGRVGSERTLEGTDSRDRRGTEVTQVSSMDNDSRIRRDTGGSEGTFEGNDRRDRRSSTGISDEISEVVSEDPEDDLGESEGSFGSEGTYDDRDEMISKQEIADQEKRMKNNNNNIIKEPALMKKEVPNQERTSTLESVPSPTREQGGSPRGKTGITQDNQSGSPRANLRNIEGEGRLQKEEDDLLEAYKARQEEMLEQERRMEEEQARREQERLDEMRLQLERRQEEERRKMAELERQRKERELAMQKEREEYENEMKRKQVERKSAEEERKRKEMERLEEMKRREEENKAR
jgi:hypothetical protein